MHPITVLERSEFLRSNRYEPLYQARCRHAWTSDADGLHAWNLGWIVYANLDGLGGFVVYEDDGRGNGDYVGDFDLLEAAALCCDRLAAQADERGF